MPYYLAPEVGTGTSRDLFRPRGSTQPGWSAISLHPFGFRLLYLPTHDPDPLLERFADQAQETLTAGRRNRFGNALGLTLTATRWDQIVAELLMTHAREDGTRWRPLRPSRVNRRFEIWLGGLLWAQPYIAGGASISENWNCADSASLTCQLTWVEFVGTNWRLLSNQADLFEGGAADNRARADSVLDSDDHECQATLVGFTQSSGIMAGGPASRVASSGDTCYEFRARNDNGTDLYHDMTRRDAGAGAQIGTAAQDPVVNQVMKIRADGSTQTGWVDGIQILSVTDTVLTGQVRCGVGGYSESTTNVLRLDTWSAADLAAGGATWPGWFHSRGGWTA